MGGNRKAGFLPSEMQKWIQDFLKETGCSISMAQSAKLKEYGKKGRTYACYGASDTD